MCMFFSFTYLGANLMQFGGNPDIAAEVIFINIFPQVEEEETLIAELKKIELRKKEREKKQQDLQKLITAADSNADNRKAERKNTKKKIQAREIKIKDGGVVCIILFSHCQGKFLNVWKVLNKLSPFFVAYP